MRPDQLQRLAAVSEKLAEVVIADVDPGNWTATNKTLAEMTQQERGDAAWCRKTAVQSVALLVRVEQLLTPAEAGKPPAAEGYDPEADIKRAERAAIELMDRVSREPASRR